MQPGNAILRFMDDQYTTIVRTVRAESKVQGSRFIATAEPLGGVEDVQGILERVRREFFDATHHCYAYRIGAGGLEFRAQDGGEPSGSAGKPILAAIERSGLTNVLVVVTRYFGGTKLGIGGLARAYGSAAAGSLQRAEKRTVFAMNRWRASFPHAQVSNVMHVLNRIGAHIVDTVYDEEVHLTLEIRKSRSTELCGALTEKTSGNIRLLPPDDAASP
jgi:uncharacterized YigZ family protein